MTTARADTLDLRHPDRLFIGGSWVEPSSGETFAVIDSHTEEPFLTVAAASAADVDRAVSAAHDAFVDGPWARLSHHERADHLRAIAAGVRERSAEISQMIPREHGMTWAFAEHGPGMDAAAYERYASLADTFAFEEPRQASYGGFGLLVRQPVGVVAAIVPWNGPFTTITHKIAPALLAGCTVIVKLAPEAPAQGYLLAEIVEAAGLPPGVVNVVTADREVSELLVKDERVDKVSFTGSTAAGRRIASLCGERIARCTLELGGKSAALILDDADIEQAAGVLGFYECINTGQVCSSLTRVVVTGDRHDQMVEALTGTFAASTVGDPFDSDTQMGPLVSQRQLDRVNGYIAKGVAEGATLATGGGRPKHMNRGYYIEPTVFGNVDNHSTIAREEIFGPVLSVIPADSEAHAIEIANDTIYGLNASVFTNDIDRAYAAGRQFRTGNVGHNALRWDQNIVFGGFKQSGIGREGGVEGLLPFLEAKLLLLDAMPSKL